jgi:putative transposase
MRLVERHVITHADPRIAAIDHAAFASKKLNNAANSVVRQSFIYEGVYLDYHKTRRRMKGHEAFQTLPATVAQWVLRILEQTWQGYFAACSAWQEDCSRFLGHPKLPGYKNKQRGHHRLVYTTQALSVPALRQSLIAPFMLGIIMRTRFLSTVQQRRRRLRSAGGE